MTLFVRLALISIYEPPLSFVRPAPGVAVAGNVAIVQGACGVSVFGSEERRELRGFRDWIRLASDRMGGVMVVVDARC
jgi:hypothetical protein